MLRRIRTTKKLAKRIDLQYFKRPHPLRRWRFWLSLAIPIVALGWLVAQRTQGGQKSLFQRPALSVARGLHSTVQPVSRSPSRNVLQAGQ